MIFKVYFGNFQYEVVVFVVKLNDQIFIDELFYGFIVFFKDLVLQLILQFFNEVFFWNFVIEGFLKCLILVVMLGDIGSVVLEGFKDVCKIDVFILYLDEGVSQIQKVQMVLVDSFNICVIGVKGDFDFC